MSIHRAFVHQKLQLREAGARGDASQAWPHGRAPCGRCDCARRALRRGREDRSQPRRYFRDEVEPPALLAVSEKVLTADVSEERAMQAMRELKGSDVPALLEAEAARTEEAGLEWRRPSRGAWPESRGP